MKFEPQLVGKEPFVRIPPGSSLKDCDKVLDLDRMSLSEFRSSMRERAQCLGPWELLPQVFLDLIKETKPLRVGIFLPKSDWAEATNLIALTKLFLNNTLTKDIHVLGPVIKDNDLNFQTFHENNIIAGPHSTWHLNDNGEIHTPDLLLMPALACDKNGGRLGRGKGYYDRYLAKSQETNSELKTCVVLHSTFLFDTLPAGFFHAWDKSVHYVMTEKSYLETSFKNIKTKNGNEVPI